MSRERQPVTIREVAERAGVSISTVSHAFSGSRPISTATRERITHAASELGYDPNPSARSLRTGRSGIVGLILRPRYAVSGSPDRAETFNRLVGSLANEMLRHKTGLIHVPDIHDQSVASVPMDGCIIAHPYGGDAALEEILRRGIPAVTVEEDPDRADFPWSVRLNYQRAITELLELLAARGARRITLLSGTEDNAWNRRPRETFLRWCTERGLEPGTGQLSEGLETRETVERIRPLLTGAERPDALIVATADGAAIVAKTAAELGVRVPDDLLLAALTDSEHARVSSPPITAMDLNHETLAEQGVAMMLERLGGAVPPEAPPLVEPELRPRASTGQG